MFSISSPFSLPFLDFTARGTQFNSPKLTVRPRLLPVRWAFCTECCQRSHQTPRLRERLMTPELKPSVRQGKTRSPRLLPAYFGTARSADKSFAEGGRPGRAGWRPLPPPGPLNSPPRLAHVAGRGKTLPGPRPAAPAAGNRLEAAARERPSPPGVHHSRLDGDPTTRYPHHRATLAGSRAGDARHLADVTAERQRFPLPAPRAPWAHAQSNHS